MHISTWYVMVASKPPSIRDTFVTCVICHPDSIMHAISLMNCLIVTEMITLDVIFMTQWYQTLRDVSMCVACQTLWWIGDFVWWISLNFYWEKRAINNISRLSHILTFILLTVLKWMNNLNRTDAVNPISVWLHVLLYDAVKWVTFFCI